MPTLSTPPYCVGGVVNDACVTLSILGVSVAGFRAGLTAEDAAVLVERAQILFFDAGAILLQQVRNWLTTSGLRCAPVPCGWPRTRWVVRVCVTVADSESCCVWSGCHQGTIGRCFHFITEGEVVVFVTEADGTKRELLRRFRGQIVGEFGILSNKPRTASAVCATASSVR